MELDAGIEGTKLGIPVTALLPPSPLAFSAVLPRNQLHLHQPISSDNSEAQNHKLKVPQFPKQITHYPKSKTPQLQTPNSAPLTNVSRLIAQPANQLKDRAISYSPARRTIPRRNKVKVKEGIHTKHQLGAEIGRKNWQNPNLTTLWSINSRAC